MVKSFVALNSTSHYNKVMDQNLPIAHEKSLLAQGTLPRYVGKRPKRRNEVDPQLYRWQWVLSLHLAGYSPAEVSELTGYAVGSVLRILHEPRVQSVRQQLLKDLDQEFEAQQSQVLKVLKEHLDSKIPDDQKWAVEVWMKVHGKYKSSGNGQTNVTAENVVMQILNGGLNGGLNGKG